LDSDGKGYEVNQGKGTDCKRKPCLYSSQMGYTEVAEQSQSYIVSKTQKLDCIEHLSHSHPSQLLQAMAIESPANQDLPD
jgi:hypothetical protein